MNLASQSRSSKEKGRLRDAWPLQKSDLGLLLGFYVAMTLLWSGIGELIQHFGEGAAIGNTDRDIEQWLVDRRTPGRNQLSLVGSMMSETGIKIAITAIVGLTLLWALRRWTDTLVIWVSLIIEAMIFLTVTTIVARPRPDVPRLDGSPVDSSFPSGHVAAAACYGAMAVVVFWHTRTSWIRALAVLLTILVPVAVGLARMYRGMHHLTDVIAGAIIGAMCVVVVTRIITRAEARRLGDEQHHRDAGDSGGNDRHGHGPTELDSSDASDASERPVHEVSGSLRPPAPVPLASVISIPARPVELEP